MVLSYKYRYQLESNVLTRKFSFLLSLREDFSIDRLNYIYSIRLLSAFINMKYLLYLNKEVLANMKTTRQPHL